MALFYGYLFSKLHLIGSKSEGPSYYLQQWDYTEVLVQKKVHPWLPDPTLHKFLNQKVTIVGKVGPQGIHYYQIYDYKPKVIFGIALWTVSAKLDNSTRKAGQKYHIILVD